MPNTHFNGYRYGTLPRFYGSEVAESVDYSCMIAYKCGSAPEASDARSRGHAFSGNKTAQHPLHDALLVHGKTEWLGGEPNVRACKHRNGNWLNYQRKTDDPIEPGKSSVPRQYFYVHALPRAISYVQRTHFHTSRLNGWCFDRMSLV